jgi:hypothetical protein
MTRSIGGTRPTNTPIPLPRTPKTLCLLFALIALSAIYNIYGLTGLQSYTPQFFQAPGIEERHAQKKFKHYPCFANRYRHDTTERFYPVNTSNIVTIYIQTAWYYMHSKIFYTFIHQFCSCQKSKDKHWILSPHSVPHFYIGPHPLSALASIYEELNKTNCGPIFLATPPTPPSINVITTAYKGSIPAVHPFDMLNDNKTIFIFHDIDDSLEGANASYVFWLTPRHSRFVVPKYFPPTIVEQTTQQSR